MSADPDRACPHETFDADVEVNRLTGVEGGPVVAFVADITIGCSACGEAFRFSGAPAGFSPAHPTVSVDEATIHLPIRPASADRDFGLGIPGYAINYRPAPGATEGSGQ